MSSVPKKPTAVYEINSNYDSVTKEIQNDILKTKLDKKLSEIKNFTIDWTTTLHEQTVNHECCDLFAQFDNSQKRHEFIAHNYAEIFFSINEILSKVYNERTLQYILTVLLQIYNEESKIFKTFVDLDEFKILFSTLMILLNRGDYITSLIAAKIITKAIVENKKLVDNIDTSVFIKWLIKQIDKQDFIQDILINFQELLIIDKCRIIFQKNDGIQTLITSLESMDSFQLQYQVIFNIWLLVYNVECVDTLVSIPNSISTLCDILKESQKEKVTRISLAALRNICTLSKNPKEASQIMIYNKLLTILNNLSNKKWNDEDISEDINVIIESLNKIVQEMTTFDEYRGEILSGRLEWSPCHTSQTFWALNAIKLCDNNYELLKRLIELLSSSNDATVLSICCHDLGEYIRHYQRGKAQFENLGGKEQIMKLLSHGDQNIRYQALVTLQKLMVHNWEFLGKQLKIDTKVN